MDRLLLALGLLVTGCSCGSRPSGSGTPSEVEPDPGPRPAAGAYEVHEWGLVRAGDGDVLTAGAIGPPRREELLVVEKPVLYFHADAATVIRRVNVTARGGPIVEAWPVPPRTGDASRLTWRDVRIDPGSACEPTPLPGVGDAACTSLPAGELCEVASLATVRDPSAACVRTAEGQDRMLFYRTRTSTFDAPLRFGGRAGALADVEVTHHGTAPIPGWLVRIHDDGSEVRALAVRPPAPGARITVGADFSGAMQGAEAGLRAVRETLEQLGMTDGEVDAFVRSWSESIFGLAPTTSDAEAAVAERSVATEESGAEDLRAPRESFLYFLPEADCDRIAHVEMDPPPRAMRRAFAVWTAL